MARTGRPALGRGHAAGLVVDDLPAAGFDLVDAIGARLDAQRTAGWADGDGAVRFARQQLRAGRATGVLRADEPARQTLKTRPPESAFGRSREQGFEMLLAQRLELADGVGRQQAGRICLQEFVERIVQRRAAVGGAQLGLQRLERLQPEDAPGIEPVGIAPPLLDAGDREPRRPRLERRFRLGTRPWPVSLGTVERIGPGEVAAPAALDVFGRAARCCPARSRTGRRAAPASARARSARRLRARRGSGARARRPERRQSRAPTGRPCAPAAAGRARCASAG